VTTEIGHHFEVYGPFPIYLTDGQCQKPTRSWWQNEVNVYDGPSPERGIGCYMFTMGTKTIKPWYIGKTWAKGGFRDEAFTEHKLGVYNKVIDKHRGPPMMYFFPLITGSFQSNWQLSNARNSSHSVINWLEKFLIGMAYSQNNDLMNIRDATFLKTVHLRGILGVNPPGRPHGEIEHAKQALMGKK
jgi:hypothetical protein